MPKVRMLRMSGLLLTVVFVLVSCDPSPSKPSKGFVVFASDESRFTLYYPQPWNLEERLGSAVEIATPPASVVMCRAQVVQGEDPRDEGLPERLARTGRMVRSMTKGFELIEESATTQDGYQRIRIDFNVQAESGKHRSVWLGLFGEGRVLVLRVVAPASGWEEVAPAVEIMLDSFRPLP